MCSYMVRSRCRSFRILTAVLLFAVAVSAQTWKRVSDGVEHGTLRREISGKPVDVSLLRLDLKKVRIDVEHAHGKARGLETTSSIAGRHKALAAINAGFFRLDTSIFAGDPVGLFMINGAVISEAQNDRIQMIVNNSATRTDVRFLRTKVKQTAEIGAETIEISGINRERKKGEIVLYTPAFGATTDTPADGLELVAVRGVINAVSDGVGNSAIPGNGYVLSASSEMRERLLPLAKREATITLVQKWEEMPPDLVRDRSRLDVVSGVPQLIRNGAIDITWERERSSKAFVETRHPRTAVAKLRDGKFLMLVADGRSEQSAGLDLNDLAKLLLELGAVDAINLDGGGSTTMFVAGKVVNRPSDKDGERKVSDALIVTPRRRR